MSRLPIRLRLTATFALAMAVVFGAAGFLLYHHLSASLDRTLALGLRARASDVSALVGQAFPGLGTWQGRPGSAQGFAQVLDTRGRILDRTANLDRISLLSPGQLARARRGPVFVDRLSVAGESVRLLATPIAAQGRRLVVVVGSPLKTRDDALATLRAELLVGGPVGLLLASVLGYLIAAAALRPVDRMRAQAAELSASRLSERLPVAPARDEVSRLGETLNELLARLETALVHERSFVADASHELRTPLALLRAEIELALESPRSRAELELALRSVAGEADRLSQLAEDLLLLARLDNGGVPLRRDDVAVGELLEGVAARFERRARDAGREIELENEAGVARLDRLRIEQALGNLVENALRYGAGTVRIAAIQEDGWLELSVCDDGAGLPAEFAPHAFERFSRAEPSRSSGGAGLGLAIVKAVAEAHGGHARVSGATVSVCVPSSQKPVPTKERTSDLSRRR
jgi:two-component system, OmpR family, sensor kinase